MKSNNTPISLALTLAAAAVLAGCNSSSNDKPSTDTGSESSLSMRSQLVGGAASVCSSVQPGYCEDWDAYWAENGDPEANVAVALTEPVELSQVKIDALVADPSWETDPDFKTGVELILNYLQQELGAMPEYADWQDFRADFISITATEVPGLPEGVDGDSIWFDSSSAQYATFEGLKKADQRLNYTVTAAKSAAVNAMVDALAADVLSDEQGVIKAVVADLISVETRKQDELLLALKDIDAGGTLIADGDALYNSDLSYLVDDDNDGDFFRLIDTLDASNFLLEQALIDAIDAQTDWDNSEHRDQVVLILQAMLDDSGEASVDYSNNTGEGNSRAVFGEAFTDVVLRDGYENGLDLWNDMPGVVRYKILELLIDDLTDYERAVEFVGLPDSTDADAVGIYEAFVEQARAASGKDMPTVLVMTSSSANSYAAADYYVGLFEQAGADAQWLPLDRAYRRAHDEGQCDWLGAYHSDYASAAHLDLLYPDYFDAHITACEQGIQDVIASADGLFINGGDQVRTFDALVTFDGEVRQNSTELEQILERQQDGELVIGGTSAGAAVQSGGKLSAAAQTNPMITAGSAHDALVNGYDAGNHEITGGIGTFPWGVTDTHFSERARETRLIRLVEQAGVRFGFGVDETTALSVVEHEEDGSREVVMGVSGAGGVYIVDAAELVTTVDAPFEASGVVTHYLTEGDTFTWYPETETYDIQFADGATALTLDQAPAIDATDDDVLYEDHYRTWVRNTLIAGETGATGTSYEDDPQYTLTISAGADTVAVQKGEQVSYQNLTLDIAHD
ncbi:cyanophycinase [Saccharospirillum alexandrii]|uniref:cyanophycinase n=1 Tax=Saccharospirillum alexandrii TaxID=2448477 RepID=UPI003734DBD7